MKWLAAAGVLLLFPAVQYGQASKQQHNVSRQKAQSDAGDTVSKLQETSPGADATAESQRKTDTPPEKSNAPQPSKWVPNSLNDVLGILTFVVTTLFLFYTIKTWKEMVRANNHTEQAHSESAVEAEENLRLTRLSNDATLRSVTVAEQQLNAIIDVTRATLTVTAVQPIRDLQQAGSAVIVDVTNTGHTTALNVKMMYGSSIHEGDNVPDFVVESLNKDLSKTTGSFGTVGPRKTIASAVELPPLNPANIERVLRGSAALWVFGKLSYDDIFGRKTTAPFLYRYTPALGQWFAGNSYNQPQHEP